MNAIDNDDETEAIDVCAYCFNNVHMSMFGIVDEFCSKKCSDAWRDWWEQAKEVRDGAA